MGWNLATAAGMPNIRNTLGSIAAPNSMPALPMYGSRPAGGYAPIPAPNIPKMQFTPLVRGGVGPGFMTATPAYKNAAPNEAQFYWGSQPYIETMADMKKLNDPAIVGTKGWAPTPPAPFDVNAFIRNTINGGKSTPTPIQYPTLPGYSAAPTTIRK